MKLGAFPVPGQELRFTDGASPELECELFADAGALGDPGQNLWCFHGSLLVLAVTIFALDAL